MEKKKVGVLQHNVNRTQIINVAFYANKSGTSK